MTLDDVMSEDSSSKGASLDDIMSEKGSGKKGFLDEHPNLRTALQIGLPTAGAIGGGLLTAPFTGGMSTLPAMSLLMAGQGVGGLLGESINQATGISPHDPTAMALETGAPMIGEPFGRFVRGAAKFIPGFGEAARASITPEMRKLPEKLFPGDSKAAYQALDAATTANNPHITSFPQLGKAANALEHSADEMPWDQLRSKLKLNGQEDLFDQIANTLKGAPAKTAQVNPTVGGKPLQTGLPKQTVVTQPARPPGLSFTEARAASEGLNTIIMSTSDPKERGVYTKLRGALLDDIENAKQPANATQNTIDLWRQARQAAKSENARAKLSAATESAIKTKDGIDIVDPNQIVKYLRTSDDIKSRVSPSEYRDIMNTYRGMSSSVGHNLGKFWGMILGSAAGATIGGLTGGAVGSAAGMSAGTLGYAASEGLSRAIMTERGRQWVRIMMNNPTTTNFRRGMSALGAGFSAAIPDREEE